MAWNECAWVTCKATIEGRGKWANIRAHNEGWYFQRDGIKWCPKHRPDWAPAIKVGNDQ